MKTIIKFWESDTFSKVATVVIVVSFVVGFIVHAFKLNN